MSKIKVKPNLKAPPIELGSLYWYRDNDGVIYVVEPYQVASYEARIMVHDTDHHRVRPGDERRYRGSFQSWKLYRGHSLKKLKEFK